MTSPNIARYTMKDVTVNQQIMIETAEIVHFFPTDQINGDGIILNFHALHINQILNLPWIPLRSLVLIFFPTELGIEYLKEIQHRKPEIIVSLPPSRLLRMFKIFQNHKTDHVSRPWIGNQEKVQSFIGIIHF